MPLTTRPRTPARPSSPRAESSLFERLLGLETEYAIRFAPERGSARPTNAQIFDTYATVLGTLVTARPGKRMRELFIANGGVVHYECAPYATADGLLEGGTPECRHPSDALLYQRAQDNLLARATPLVQRELATAGFHGELSLLKNCRDAAGNIYGAQDNYEVDIASGAALVAWRAGLVALAPLVLASTLLTWAFIVALIPFAIVALTAYGVGKAVLKRDLAATPVVRVLERVLWWIERAIWEPTVVLFLLLYRAFAFRRIRRTITPFLISRQVITGAGTLVNDRFALSEKAIGTRQLCRTTIGKTRAIFDAGNLCKQLASLVTFDARYSRLFRRRQRLQLGLSDSNMAQTAEYLKVATTCLVIDMAEAGVLDDLPQIRRPLRRLHELARGDIAGALAIQRAYVERARRFVREASATSLEATEVVARWAAILDALEREPAQLVGRIDWITKQTLIERAGTTPDERKKIDLKYHELRTGYFALLEEHGLAPMLVTADEMRTAETDSPADTPARARARMMRDLDGVANVTVGWNQVRVGGPVRGRVIKLERD